MACLFFICFCELDYTLSSTVQQIRKYYDEFLGWANEFDLASVSRKRSILAQLFEKTGLINLFIDNLQQMEKFPHWLFLL